MMRSPERITTTLDLLKKLWVENPDMRFNQLIYNIQRGYSVINADFGRVEITEKGSVTRTGFDFFSLEDAEFIKHLKTVLVTSSW